jgi:hypothetical protein
MLLKTKTKISSQIISCPDRSSPICSETLHQSLPANLHSQSNNSQDPTSDRTFSSCVQCTTAAKLGFNFNGNDKFVGVQRTSRYSPMSKYTYCFVNFEGKLTVKGKLTARRNPGPRPALSTQAQFNIFY